MAFKTPSKRSANKALFYRIERYAALVEAAYNTASKEAAKLAVSLDYDGTKPFQWSDYPQTSSKIKKIVESLYSSVNLVVVNGVKAEWGNAEIFNDEVVTNALGMYGVKLEERLDVDGNPTGSYIIPDKYKSYFKHSNEALSSFLSSKNDSLNLSAQIWKQSEQFKENLELIFTDGLREGTSAANLSRSIREYLNEPDKLFRRVSRGENNLVLSKAAKKYKPKAGQYRSSYKNAMRVTRTVINMSYATADYERAQALDFVVGVQIHRSNKGCECSMCERLKGKYPKDFNFSGKWHPQCMCYLTYILKTTEEFWSESSSSKRTIKSVPKGYKRYLSDNATKIKEATKNGTLPYFLRDNKSFS